MPGPARVPGRRGLLAAVLGVVVAVVVLALVRASVVQSFAVGSGSMQPLLQPGDRVLASRLGDPGQDVARGDVVVFDGSGVYAPELDPTPSVVDRAAEWAGLPSAERYFVKRVVGLPGDRVACCDATGAMTVGGTPVTEPYLYPGDRPSEVPFDVVVPAGRLWLMGDHRSASADSRGHLGDPGGGMVPVDRVIGPVVALAWPPSRISRVGAPARPTDQRSTDVGTTDDDGTGTG